jgi:diadenosine tetraphosphatase ApaH/serine/threonine PP2A family protein phosphatase
VISHKQEEKVYFVKKYLINIGSVGQPRDGDPRSAYLIYDDEENIVRSKRVSYDLSNTQKLMAEHGFPEYLIERLAVGR